MNSCTLIALARPTFQVDAAQKFFDQARALLEGLGVTVNGPTNLVMTAEDTESAKANLRSDEDLYILLNASFSDASPAVSLLADVKGNVLLWSVREFGNVGDRLLLNSMCGSNLASHALRTAGKSTVHIHGNPDEAEIKESLRDALSGKLPNIGEPARVHGDKAESDKVDQALASLKVRRLAQSVMLRLDLRHVIMMQEFCSNILASK